ncbi:MAG: hypothetical protein EPO08_17385 [Rhodospirillaceae bacterium]|nr:MAG: hypothetical protein EPO08_17385 [Rhodospirillaceae bacterium]
MTKTPRRDHLLAEEIARSLPSGGRKGAAADAKALLQRARDAGGGSLRFHFLSRAQQAIAKLDPARQQGLIQRLQGEILALQGRGGDTKIAHLTPGEVVIPKRLQTPEFMRDVAELARAYGIDPASLVIGDPRNAINPHTGQPEFDDGSYDDAASDGSDSAGDSGATDAAPSDSSSQPPLASSQNSGPIQPPQDGMETVTVTGQRLPQLSPADQELLARMIFTEGDQDYKTPGLFQALGSAALNRQGLPQYGNSMSHIINQPRQFQGVGLLASDPNKQSLWQLSANPDQLTGPNKAAFATARAAASGLVDGGLSDNTGGATLFGSGQNGIMPDPMQKDVDSGAYEKSRDDIGNWAFLRPRKRP